MMANVLEYRSGSEREPAVLSGLARVGYVFGACVVPPIGLLVAAVISSALMRGQDAELSDWPALLLGWRATVLVLPLVSYAGACMVALVVNWERFYPRPAERVGVAMGVVLNIHYAVIAAVVYFPIMLSGDRAAIICWIVCPAITVLVILGGLRMLSWLRRRWGSGWTLVGLAIAVAVIVPGWVYVAGQGTGSVGLAGLALLIPALPLWPLLSYVKMWRLIRRMDAADDSAEAPFNIRPAGWLAGISGAWVVSIVGAAVQYSFLPPGNPSLSYIATAAARGHRRVVKSRAVRQGDGRVALVNAQLRVLVCAEIALHVICPALRRSLRRAYDRLGPPIARQLDQPILADLAYVSLKPVEYVARAFLGVLFDRPMELAGMAGGAGCLGR